MQMSVPLLLRASKRRTRLLYRSASIVRKMLEGRRRFVANNWIVVSAVSSISSFLDALFRFFSIIKNNNFSIFFFHNNYYLFVDMRMRPINVHKLEHSELDNKIDMIYKSLSIEMLKVLINNTVIIKQIIKFSYLLFVSISLGKILW